MERLDKIRLTRKDMLKLSAGGAGMFALTASGFAVPRGLAGGGGGGGGSLYIEAFPTSPLITSPFKDPLNVPSALRPTDPMTWDSHGAGEMPRKEKQDSIGPSPTKEYYNKYGQTLGEHQLWPKDINYSWLSPDPVNYQIKLQVGGHAFTSSSVQAINSFGKNVVPPKGASVNGDGTAQLRKSTIYGFSNDLADGTKGPTFPGPRINAEYGRASLVRFENWLDKNPDNLERGDFGAPNYSFLTHLHNGHTAPESDGQPH